MKNLLIPLRPLLVLFLALSLLTGVVYPFVVTGLARSLFPSSEAVQFREFDEIKAVSEGRGWQTVN